MVQSHAYYAWKGSICYKIKRLEGMYTRQNRVMWQDRVVIFGVTPEINTLRYAFNISALRLWICINGTATNRSHLRSSPIDCRCRFYKLVAPPVSSCGLLVLKRRTRATGKGLLHPNFPVLSSISVNSSGALLGFPVAASINASVTSPSLINSIFSL